MSFFDHVVKDGDDSQEGSREGERRSPWCSTSDVQTRFEEVGRIADYASIHV